jgi:rod shape-determining protein MreD
MLQKITIFLIIFFAAILQLAVFPDMFFWGLGPNILLILVIFWVIQEGFEGALFQNILAGLTLDFATFSVVGTNIATFLLVAFLISFISKRFLVVARNWRIFILTITIIFATLANNLYLNGIFYLASYFGKTAIGNLPVPFFSFLLAKEIVLNVLFFPLIYFFLKKIAHSNLVQNRKQIF